MESFVSLNLTNNKNKKRIKEFLTNIIYTSKKERRKSIV